MVRQIRKTVKETVDGIPWMDDVTKSRAKEKVGAIEENTIISCLVKLETFLQLDNVKSLVGFPDDFLDFAYIDNLHGAVSHSKFYPAASFFVYEPHFYENCSIPFMPCR